MKAQDGVRLDLDGLFGHELPKATVLTGNLPSLPSLKRRMTLEWRIFKLP